MTLDEILLAHGAEYVDQGLPDNPGQQWVIELSKDRERFMTTIALLGAQFVPGVFAEGEPDTWPRWYTPSGQRVVTFMPRAGRIQFVVYARGFRMLLPEFT